MARGNVISRYTLAARHSSSIYITASSIWRNPSR
jgi:hypothetical protein